MTDPTRIAMTPWGKLVRADRTRKTRFHTSNGRLCLNPADMAFAFASTLLRHATGRLVPTPWLCLPAVRFLRGRVVGAVVFEYSTGMSTIWYARRCRQVWAVEHNRAWSERIAERTRGCDNVELIHESDAERYVRSIERPGIAQFDVISIDGIRRLDCFRHAVPFLKPGGLMIVDNTDAESTRGIDREIERHFAPGQVHRFAGFAPGIFHPTETTVCVGSS